MRGDRMAKKAAKKRSAKRATKKAATSKRASTRGKPAERNGPAEPAAVALASLKPDAENPRVRDARAKSVLRSSLREFGAARSIVVDGEGVIRAGNGTVEAALENGIESAVMVEADGETLVIVQRTDLRGVSAIAYGLADNRTGELSRWAADTLQRATEVSDEVLSLDSLGLDEKSVGELVERARLLADPDRFGCIIRCHSEDDQLALMAELADEGKDVQPLVS